MKPHPLAATADATPTSFTFDATIGQWQPYEFVANNSEASLRFDRLRKTPVFMDEFAKILMDYNTDSIFGIHLEHRDHISGARTIESPGEAEDELLIKAAEPSAYEAALI